MPFKSKAQQRFFFAAESKGAFPPGTARRWAHETEDISSLPEHVEDDSSESGGIGKLGALLSFNNPFLAAQNNRQQMQRPSGPYPAAPFSAVNYQQNAQQNLAPGSGTNYLRGLGGIPLMQNMNIKETDSPDSPTKTAGVFDKSLGEHAYNAWQAVKPYYPEALGKQKIDTHFQNKYMDKLLAKATPYVIGGLGGAAVLGGLYALTRPSRPQTPVPQRRSVPKSYLDDDDFSGISKLGEALADSLGTFDMNEANKHFQAVEDSVFYKLAPQWKNMKAPFQAFKQKVQASNGQITPDMVQGLGSFMQSPNYGTFASLYAPQAQYLQNIYHQATGNNAVTPDSTASGSTSSSTPAPLTAPSWGSGIKDTAMGMAGLGLKGLGRGYNAFKVLNNKRDPYNGLIRNSAGDVPDAAGLTHMRNPSANYF